MRPPRASGSVPSGGVDAARLRMAAVRRSGARPRGRGHALTAIRAHQAKLATAGHRIATSVVRPDHRSD